MHNEKENRKKDFYRQQEKGGEKTIVTVGDYAECPECSRMGHIVWVSKDGKTAGIRCPASHNIQDNTRPRIGALEPPRHKTNKNSVFLTEVK